MNAALAVAMLRHQDRLDVSKTALTKATQSADWPARMQRLKDGPLTQMLPSGSELWLDGGHNPSAARAVADHVSEHFGKDLPLVLVFSSLASKDPYGTLKPFRGVAERVHMIPIPDHEYRDPEQLARLARAMLFDASAHANLAAALAPVAGAARVLIFGSLYVAGEALSANGEVPR
jgi:dihydrofolate synthase/folylpolyglutamate synthase